MSSTDPTLEHVLIELHSKEVELITLLRQIRFGEVAIMLRDGLPVDVIEIIKRRRLGAGESGP